MLQVLFGQEANKGTHAIKHFSQSSRRLILIVDDIITTAGDHTMRITNRCSIIINQIWPHQICYPYYISTHTIHFLVWSARWPKWYSKRSCMQKYKAINGVVLPNDASIFFSDTHSILIFQYCSKVLNFDCSIIKAAGSVQC